MLLSHACRGPTYALLFVAVPNLRLEGAWFLALLLLLAIDLAMSLWDSSVETRSRALLGGLPAGEYVLHVLIAMLFGALVAAVLFEGGWRRGARPPRSPGTPRRCRASCAGRSSPWPRPCSSPASSTPRPPCAGRGPGERVRAS